MNRKLTIGILLALFVAAGCNTNRSSNRETSKPLFNGKDFDGWYIYLRDLGKNNDPNKIFQITDGGVIHIYKDAEQGSNQPFGYLCTEKDYGDCRIRFDYKWGEKRFGSRATRKRDSGILYFTWSDDGKGIGIWPMSVECQVQEGDTGDTFAIGSQVSATVDPATMEKNPATTRPKAPTFQEGGVSYTSPLTGNNRIVRSEMLEKDGWNTVEIVLKGDTADHIVNGKRNMRLTNITRPDPDRPTERRTLNKGRILFQAEGAEVFYRNIKIEPLK